jgi:hypothetical protein
MSSFLQKYTLSPENILRSTILFTTLIIVGFVAFSGNILAQDQPIYRPLDQRPNPLFSNFSFGCSYNNFDGCPGNSQIQSGPWVLDSWNDGNSNWLKNFDKSSNDIPYIYNYVIAGMAKKDWGLADCNVRNYDNLCQKGADYIRNNLPTINQRYGEIAQNIAQIWGINKPILMHMEPDFYQYYSDSHQQNPLSIQESWNIMNSIVRNIKNILPNAYFVLDTSSWASNLAYWSSGFQGFSYAGLVGKRFAADGDDSSNEIDGKTYSEISSMTGLRLIVDTSYGIGGDPNNFDFSWTVKQTLQDRFSDGVVAILEPGNKQNQYYSNLISNYANSIY